MIEDPFSCNVSRIDLLIEHIINKILNEILPPFYGKNMIINIKPVIIVNP